MNSDPNMSIHFGCYANKIEKDFQFFGGDPYDKITENFSASFDSLCDRSDLATLNNEHESNALEIVELITYPNNNSHPYTHIVKDSEGHYFAVQFAKGDWLRGEIL
ncbi:hypothetical protein [Terribacillus saccharophilus]|uniref:hypothetical protein n=1 Tax=Terribacillus saccharophilus TaxID=361277 RepID=UPI003D28CCFC